VVDESRKAGHRREKRRKTIDIPIIEIEDKD